MPGGALGRLSKSVLAEAISSRQTGVRDLGGWVRGHQWNNSQVEVRA